MEKRGACVSSLDAKLLLEAVSDILEIDMEAENVDTIGGWLSAEVASPPRIGQQAAFGGNVFFVEEIDNVRITRVLVHLHDELKEEHEEISEEYRPA